MGAIISRHPKGEGSTADESAAPKQEAIAATTAPAEKKDDAKAGPGCKDEAKGEPDPYFDLIIHEKLARNEYPKEELEAARAAGHTSLAAQCCTEEVWNKYKDLKSSGPAKWTLARAINSGVMYPSSFVGCHAGDFESWDDFKDFFYPVVKLYHVGFDPDNTPPLDPDHMNPDKITVDLSDSAKTKIISTRIRCARNLIMFPLNPGGSLETRMAIADLMEQVYATLEGDLGGQMFRHTTMTDEQRQGLIDSHHLFRGKDKMQAASGYHEHWPQGRGVFHNADKTFVNWINEGDHLRIISMENGSDVKGVFARLARGAKAIEDGVKQVTGKGDGVFMMHPKFGSVACCPSNLGTGMRGSVHILVPGLIEKKGFDWIDAKARTMHCQARGSSGEHSEVVDRIDVSNWRRIGLPEYQLVTDMITFANWLSEQEDKIQAGQDVEEKNAEPDPYFDLIIHEKLARNEYPKEELDAARAAGHTSLAAQCCTEEVWNKYKDLKSSGPAKWTLARAINSGVMYPSSFVGCHAGDFESWDDFKDFFYPVVKLYHVGFDPDNTPPLDPDHMNPDKITVDLSDSAKTKIISTRIRCARNLIMFPLNPGGSLETRMAIADLMEQVYATLEGDLGGQMFRHTTMTDEQRQGLIDSHHLFRGKDKMQAASGYHEHWPQGRGVFHNADKTFVNWINEGDHLRIISMENGSDVKGVFARLARGAKAIEDGVKQVTGKGDGVFMMHPKFGSVACCPSNLGTGMRGSVHILVPGLIEKKGFDWIDAKARTMHCQARGSSGEHSEVVDRIDVSNWRRIGLPEYQLVTDMITFANWLSEQEDKIQAGQDVEG